MIRHRSSSWLLCAESQRPTRFAQLRALGRPLLSLGRQRRESAILRVHDQRRAQIAGELRLALVESELAEVVVHVGDGSGRRLLAFVRGGAFLDFDRFRRRVELLGHVLGPLERRVGGVGPEPLEVRLPVRRARRRVGLRRLARSRSRGRRLSCDSDRGQRHDGDRHETDAGEQWTSHRKSPGWLDLAASRFAYHTRPTVAGDVRRGQERRTAPEL